MVEIAFACGHEDVVYSRFQLLLERSVAAYGESSVGAVVAYHVYEAFGQFVAVFFVDPAFDGLYDFGAFERHDLIPASAVAAIGGEVAAVVWAFEGHAEVVAL